MASKVALASAEQPRALENRQQRRWYRCLPIFLSLTVLALTGCGGPETSTRVASVETSSNQRVDRTLRGERLVSKQAPVGLRLPRNWRAVPGNALHPTADLQAYNPEREIYLVVVGEDRANVTAPDDLNQQAAIYVQLLKDELDRLISNQTSAAVTSVNGFDAVQYDVRGEVLGTDVAYLHTTVAMHGKYYQVVAWTPLNRYSENADAMKAITQEVRSD